MKSAICNAVGSVRHRVPVLIILLVGRTSALESSVRDGLGAVHANLQLGDPVCCQLAAVQAELLELCWLWDAHSELKLGLCLFGEKWVNSHWKCTGCSLSAAWSCEDGKWLRVEAEETGKLL